MAEKADHVVSPWIYVAVLLALMLLLVLTAAASCFDLDKMIGLPYMSMTVAILIAISKATLIVLFFMHIKFNSRIHWAFASAGFVWLGIMMTLSLSDYLTRDYQHAAPSSAPMQASQEHMRPSPPHRAEVPGASAAPMRETGPIRTG